MRPMIDAIGLHKDDMSLKVEEQVFHFPTRFSTSNKGRFIRDGLRSLYLFSGRSYDAVTSRRARTSKRLRRVRKSRARSGCGACGAESTRSFGMEQARHWSGESKREKNGKNDGSIENCVRKDSVLELPIIYIM